MAVIAIYLRLSLEDKNTIDHGANQDESNSISNQRALLHNYIHHNSEFKDYEVIEFCDDGYSGTSMNRPGMKRLY